MTYYEEVLKNDMDGIVFYSLLSNPYDVNCEFYQEYTREQLRNATCFPRSGRAFYRMKNGKRKYYNDAYTPIAEPCTTSALETNKEKLVLLQDVKNLIGEAMDESNGNSLLAITKIVKEIDNLTIK